jgi:hypothetical protein
VTIETTPKGEGKKKGFKTSSLLHATFQHNFFVHLEMLQKKKKKRSSQDLLACFALLCFSVKSTQHKRIPLMLFCTATMKF